MSASARQQKHEEERPCWPAFHFHSVLLIFVYLWPIWTFCVADMDMLWPIWFVADIVVSRCISSDLWSPRTDLWS